MERRETRTWKDRNGLRLVGEIQGPADGQLIVLMHGTAETRHSWRSTADRLVEFGFQVMAYDARGHGDSCWSDSGDYELESLAADLLTVVESVGAPNPVLVGASIGADTSLVAAGECGLPVSSVVIVDALPETGHGGSPRTRGVVRSSRTSALGMRTQAAEERALFQPQRHCSENLETKVKKARPGSECRFPGRFDPRFANGDVGLDRRRERLNAALEAISAPVLFIRGMLSDVLTDDGVAEFRAIRPDAECVTVRRPLGMGVGVYNDLVGVAVAEFLLRSIPSPSRTWMSAVQISREFPTPRQSHPRSLGGP
jgi:pimeloyl-ACP methyl ester carboxylesterase